MENFFIDDNFYSDLNEFIDHLDVDSVEEIPNEWTWRAELSTFEPMFKLDSEIMASLVGDAYDERYGEDQDLSEKIIKALNESVDWDKLNSLIPKFYYANGEYETITKQDLIDHLTPPK